jgi:hypothetical protein
MSAQGGRYVRSAIIGFSVAAAFVRYQLITDTQSPLARSPIVMIMFLVLCPPSVLSVVFDPEVGTSDFYLLWTLIALINAGLYAGFRMFRTRRLQHPD